MTSHADTTLYKNNSISVIEVPTMYYDNEDTIRFLLPKRMYTRRLSGAPSLLDCLNESVLTFGLKNAKHYISVRHGLDIPWSAGSSSSVH
jgi:hypothetical protein